MAEEPSYVKASYIDLCSVYGSPQLPQLTTSGLATPSYKTLLSDAPPIHSLARFAGRAPPSASQLPTAHMISGALKNEAPNAHTPFHCHRLHAKPAMKVPSAPPAKYVTMKTVLIRLRASGINL